MSVSDPGAKLSIDEVERRLLKNLAAKYDDTKCEASSLDLIKMTKNWLEFVQKNITTTNLNVGTWPKFHTKELKPLN